MALWKPHLEDNGYICYCYYCVSDHWDTHLHIVDVFKQVAAVIAHREVKWTEEAALLLAEATHLMVSWRQKHTERQREKQRQSMLKGRYTLFTVSLWRYSTKEN